MIALLPSVGPDLFSFLCIENSLPKWSIYFAHVSKCNYPMTIICVMNEINRTFECQINIFKRTMAGHFRKVFDYNINRRISVSPKLFFCKIIILHLVNIRIDIYAYVKMKK